MNTTNNLNASDFGGFTISNNVLKGGDIAAFWYRDVPVDENDNGWRIIGLDDTEEYLNDSNNWSIVGINTVFEIMPFILTIFDLDIGTDLQVVYKDGLPYKIYDVNAGKYIL